MPQRPYPPRPKLACEVAAGQVVAARAADRERALEVCTLRRLEAGWLRPGLQAGNLANREAVSQAIAGALAAVGGRARDVIAILPDAAVRVMLLDFDSLPEKDSEAKAIVRFRLRKSLPFDVEAAALSYQSWRANGQVSVVAAVAPGGVVEDYEAAFRDAGYDPGVVLPSILAALGAVEADRPTVLVKVDSTTSAVAIVDNEELRLLRIFDNPHGLPPEGPALADNVYTSLVFYEDTYGSKIERLLVGGVAPVAALAPSLEAQTRLPVEELLATGNLGESLAGDIAPRSLLAGVAGVLLS